MLTSLLPTTHHCQQGAQMRTTVSLVQRMFVLIQHSLRLTQKSKICFINQRQERTLIMMSFWKAGEVRSGKDKKEFLRLGLWCKNVLIKAQGQDTQAGRAAALRL